MKKQKHMIPITKTFSTDDRFFYTLVMSGDLYQHNLRVQDTNMPMQMNVYLSMCNTRIIVAEEHCQK
jgi:hypothetical protein